MSKTPYRQIRAVYSDKTIRVYQAYSPVIAKKALEAGTLVSPAFKMNRMTWIKPSFLWMNYRAGWGMKSGQEYILGIDITRSGFEWALQNSVLSHYDTKLQNVSKDEWRILLRKTPVRIQWDPERDIYLNRVNYRSIQIGLSGIAVNRYVNEWIESIEDVTPYCQKIMRLVKIGEVDKARRLLPAETPYVLSSSISKIINSDD